MNQKIKTYAICGLSSRGIGHYVLPMIGNPQFADYGNFTKYARLVGILDIDAQRVKKFNENMGTHFPYYPADALDRMIQETRPDVVVVAGPDGTHAQYIIGALRQNCDVITEKPMVISCDQAQQVIDAQRASKASARVAHNLRFAPAHKQIKQMIMDGLLGRITNVEFTYNLDTYHGSSYFKRWNREREKSGGLTITKGCHHFDLINWWLDDQPAQVFAYGALNYYGKDSPHNPQNAGDAATCPYQKHWYAPELASPKDDILGVRNKAFDLPFDVQYPGGRTFGLYDKEIAIEDTYSAVVRYRRGASMSYSCNFSTPWEGYVIGINGTHGRLETRTFTAPSRCPFPVDQPQTVTYYPLFGQRQVWDIRKVKGGHGGADDAMKWDIFTGTSEENRKLGLYATPEDGAYAVAIGELIWRSIQTNRPLDVPVF